VIRPHVRVASEADVSTLLALRLTWNEEHQERTIDDPEFEARFTEWVASEWPTRTFFLADVDGVPVGMGNVKRYDRMPAAGMTSAGWWGYVGNVFVLPAHRDGGVGEALMRGLTDWARDAGMAHLRLAPSPRAVPFYERLGYVPGAVVELDP
jgi:GNAT superfamily N-acetyltransferase